ncbi:MAG: HDIG domain-containing protein [Rikenellaceae bacterium]|nr:HDIG domain-containing protein [Rikenellaceae bacterium]
MGKKQYIWSAFLFVTATVLIIWMIPRGGRYLQNFNLGELWRGETLSAPFDFSISKSETEVFEDLQHAQKSYIPVYSYDPNVQNQVWTSIESQLYLTQDSAEVGRSIRAALGFVYAKGVASGIEHFYSDEQGRRYIRLDKEGTLETVSVQEVFTPATAAEYIQRDPILSTVDWYLFLMPNLTYSQSLNVNLQERELKSVARTRGIVYQNEVVVSNGQLIDQEVYNKLNSLKSEYRNRLGSGSTFVSSTLGHALIVIILMGITILYFYYFRRNFLTQKRNVLFVLMVYLIMVGLCAAVNRTDNLSVYVIPFAIVPIYILTFFDVRMSIFELTTILLVCSLIVPKPLEYMIINFVGGVIAVFVLGRAYRRAKVFLATGLIFLSNCVCYLAMLLIQEGSLNGFNYMMLIWFAANAILFLGMYQLVYLFEKMFGFVSDITLFELSDTNQKLLLELARQAPGTFQHTLQVANLAEAAAKVVGARSLLARTGALYHDIGKTGNPGYFIENRGSGNNPHDQLSPVQSAAIIRKHVTDGLAMAKKQRLPAIISEFITGHHGDSLMYFFYAKQKEINGGIEQDEALFRYDGAKPVRREVSIVMMADAVEAASRSLPEYTEESIGALVDKIIDTQIREGALQNSEISFHDIGRIKQVFKEYLSNVYHTRISYPEREVPTPAG